MADHGFNTDRPKSVERHPVRNPHLSAIWDVNGHGITNDDNEEELPLLDLINPHLVSPEKTPNQVGLRKNLRTIVCRTVRSLTQIVTFQNRYSYNPFSGNRKTFFGRRRKYPD